MGTERHVAAERLFYYRAPSIAGSVMIGAQISRIYIYPAQDPASIWPERADRAAYRLSAFSYPSMVSSVLFTARFELDNPTFPL